MRAVVDKNVAAYYLLGTQPFANEAQQFWREIDETLAPAVWEAELANALWMAIRTGVLTLEEGQKRLGLAAGLGIHSVSIRTLWRGSLVRAVNSGVAVYDALFLELADRERLLLATYDKKLLDSFPKVAKRPRAIFQQ